MPCGLSAFTGVLKQLTRRAIPVLQLVDLLLESYAAVIFVPSARVLELQRYFETMGAPSYWPTAMYTRGARRPRTPRRSLRCKTNLC